VSLPSAQSIREDFEFLDDWEDRYRYIIELGKQLPAMAEELRIPANIIHGCQSQVWISYQLGNDRLQLLLDSDAHIVRGLIAVVMSAFNDQPPREILDYDIEKLFDDLDLLRHLSPTRGNGLVAMVSRIRQVARENLAEA